LTFSIDRGETDYNQLQNGPHISHWRVLKAN
jgi:hypothetical protein